MTRTTPDLAPPMAAAPARFSPLASFATLVRLSLARHLRGRRLLVVGLLFLIPAGIVALARWHGDDSPPADLEFAAIYALIPHALAPLAALIYASGMIQDEVEDQTLTYLLLRPLPRWAIYLGKLAATLGVVVALTALSVATALVAIHWGEPGYWWPAFPRQALAISGILGLALLAYVSIFGLAGLFIKRMLVVGVTYLSVFEGLIANIDFVVRRATVNYNFRILCARWLGVDRPEWALNLDEAPAALTSLATLLGVSAVAAILAGLAMTWREFRVKTPEGN